MYDCITSRGKEGRYMVVALSTLFSVKLCVKSSQVKFLFKDGTLNKQTIHAFFHQAILKKKKKRKLWKEKK